MATYLIKEKYAETKTNIDDEKMTAGLASLKVPAMIVYDVATKVLDI